MTQEGIMNTTSPHITDSTRALIAAAVDADGMAQIGRTRHDLVGIRYSDAPGGGAPSGEPGAGAPVPGAQTPAGTNPPAPTTPAPGQQTPAPANPPAPQPPATQFTPEQTAQRIHDLNEEAKTARLAKETAEAAAKTAQDQLTAVLAAAGIKPDGSPLEKSPEKLQAEIAERTQATEKLVRENLVLRVAGKHEANADRLLDSSRFSTELSALKVDDLTGVDALVKKWVDEDAAFKAAPPAAASSGSTTHTGTPANNGQRKGKEAAIAERMAASGALPQK